tara:strand:+ start:93 stop:1289 length:1197 start_codon:yes stop_codon:yes gene_type:complete
MNKTDNYKTITQCRICGTVVSKLLDLNNQPLANNFHNNELQEEYPLKLMLCSKCFHTQLSVVVEPTILFKNYIYVSGTSQTLINYFKWFVKKIINITSVTNGSVLEIACNDCSLLNIFKNNNWDTWGVDPAENIYHYTKNSEHNIICDYWSKIVATKINKCFDVIVAQNVFAHIHDVDDFIEGCKQCMNNNSLLFIQTSQCNMFKNNEFDTIYHEHLSFFSVKSMKYILNKHNLYILDILFPKIHGTSYLFVISKNKTNKVNKYYNIEQQEQRYNIEFYKKYSKYCYNIVKLTTKLTNLMKDYSIVGFGAAAKANTFLNFTKFNLSYIIDENPAKQGLYSPGMNIPIYGMDKLKNDKRKLCIVILAWNFKDEIIKKIKISRPDYLDKYVVFYPQYEIL